MTIQNPKATNQLFKSVGVLLILTNSACNTTQTKPFSNSITPVKYIPHQKGANPDQPYGWLTTDKENAEAFQVSLSQKIFNKLQQQSGKTSRNDALFKFAENKVIKQGFCNKQAQTVSRTYKQDHIELIVKCLDKATRNK
ncbi:MAG: hypothetical protein HON94_08720 [Methylococcales bacterium]|nr:hypothetical protein [Methylococcales bacterium]MBT7409262.1 hypothetical protein [Methylococcales bacterium]